MTDRRDAKPSAALQTRPFQPRAVRLGVTGVIARFGESRLGHVLNISVSGALLRLNASAVVGECEELTLVRGSYLVRVSASVVRISRNSAPDATDEEWNIAVQFKQSPSAVRSYLTGLLDRGSPGVSMMVDGVRDRRLPTRLPDPACPSCGAEGPDVQVTDRLEKAIAFGCARCQHSWLVPKPLAR